VKPSSLLGNNTNAVSLYADGITVEGDQLEACNGVIYAMDAVLLHPAVERMVLEQPDAEIQYTPAPEVIEAEQEQADKITICHATHSDSNPYVEITISQNGLNGHKHHEGDVIPAPPGGCVAQAPVTTQEATEAPAVSTEEAAAAICAGGTIADRLRADGRFSTFVALMEQEGLMETLEEPGPFTIFAPTNEAFDNLPDGVLDSWKADDALLTTVLLYHCVKGTYTRDALVTETEVKTINKSRISVVVIDETIYLNRMVTVEDEGVDVPDTSQDDDGAQDNGSKITICHRTSSAKNPYVMITVSQSAIPAHQGHGDIIPAPAGGCPGKGK
jgi:uncharacterized surface protein with fasciclin (FAS1) repeats